MGRSAGGSDCVLFLQLGGRIHVIVLFSSYCVIYELHAIILRSDGDGLDSGSREYVHMGVILEFDDVVAG